MRVEMKQTMQIPEDKIFVDEFTVDYGEEGLVVSCKSKVFAAWIRHLAGGDIKPITYNLESLGYRANDIAFDIDGKKFYNLSELQIPLDFLSPVQQRLLNKGAEGIGANLTFLTLPGLEDGVSLTARLPVSVADAHDYYYGCLQAFQSLYLDYVRPFTITALLQEVD